MPTGNFKWDSMQEFVETVNLASEGQLELKLHPAGAIVPGAKEFDAIHDGILDFGEVYGPYWLDKMPHAGVFAYTVGGLSALEHLFWMLGGGGQELLDEMIAPYNVKVFQGKPYSPETFLWTNEPLRTLNDVKKLTIRTAGDDGECFKKMGAGVVFVPGGEIYEAMQRGVTNSCQASSPSIDITLAIQEVAKYAYLSPVRQPTDYQMLGVSTKSWEALSPGLQKIVTDAYLANGISTYAKATLNDIKALEFIKDYGVIVEPASEEIVDELIRQANILYDERAASDPFAAELIESIREFKESYAETFERL